MSLLEIQRWNYSKPRVYYSVKQYDCVCARWSSTWSNSTSWWYKPRRWTTGRRGRGFRSTTRNKWRREWRKWSSSRWKWRSNISCWRTYKVGWNDYPSEMGCTCAAKMWTRSVVTGIHKAVSSRWVWLNWFIKYNVSKLFQNVYTSTTSADIFFIGIMFKPLFADMSKFKALRHLLSNVILSAWNLKKFTNFFKFVVFGGKEWCFIIWLNMAYYTTIVSVINAKSSIYINLLK